MKIGGLNIIGTYLGEQSVRTYLGSQLVLPTVTISGTWDPSLTDKNKKVIISGDVTLTGKTDCYSLTFETGGHLTINAGARLRIWQGGIVNNDCTTVNYLTIVEDAVNDSYGEFLLHPDVTVNNHPLGTVKYKTQSYVASSYASEKIAYPFTLHPTLITTENDYKFRVALFNYTDDKWEYKFGLNGAAEPEDYTLLNPWVMTNHFLYAPSSGYIIEITGLLIINDNPSFYLRSNYHNGAGISLLAKFRTAILESMLPSTLLRLESKNSGTAPEILHPMDAIDIVMSSSYTTGTLTLSYKDLVWDPSFEEEVTPTLSLSKGSLMMSSSKPTEIDTTLEGSGIFDNPEPSFLPE